MDESLRPCVICHEQSQQMLMLSCVHDPCINCAALHFSEKQNLNARWYKCPKCYKKTELDSESIKVLKNTYNNQKSSKYLVKEKHGYKNSISTSYTKDQSQVDHFPQTIYVSPLKNQKQNLLTYSYSKQRLKATNIYRQDKYSKKQIYQQKNVYQNFLPRDKRRKEQIQNEPDEKQIYSFKNSLIKNTKNKINNVSIDCPDHPDDELSYYCFTCFKLICPECAIHGKHQKHEVQAMKRAVRQIKENLINLKEEMVGKTNNILKEKNANRSYLKQQSFRNRSYLQQVKTNFCSLKNELILKQKQIIKLIQSNNKSNCEELNSRNETEEELIRSQNEIKNKIQQALESEQISILENYASLWNEVKNLTDRNLCQAQFQIKACNLSMVKNKIEEITSILQGIEITFQTLII